MRLYPTADQDKCFPFLRRVYLRAFFLSLRGRNFYEFDIALALTDSPILSVGICLRLFPFFPSTGISFLLATVFSLVFRDVVVLIGI